MKAKQQVTTPTLVAMGAAHAACVLTKRNYSGGVRLPQPRWREGFKEGGYTNVIAIGFLNFIVRQRWLILRWEHGDVFHPTHNL